MTTNEYKISNALIWLASAAPLSILPILLKVVEISEFTTIDWVIFVSIFSILPLTALLYRSKVVVENDTFKIYRGIIGNKWYVKSKPQKFIKIRHPIDNEKGFLSFETENGKEIYFEPEKSFKDTFIRRKSK